MKRKQAEAPVRFLPRVSLNRSESAQKREQSASVLLCACVFALALFGCLFLLLNLFNLTVYLMVCLIAVLAFWAIWTALFALTKGKQRLWLLAPVLAAVIVSLLMWPPLRVGLLRYYNLLADMLNETTYLVVPRVPLETFLPSSVIGQNTLAVCFLIFWVSLPMAFATVGRPNILLLILSTVLFLWMPIGFRIEPPLSAFFAVLTSYFTMYTFLFGLQRQKLGAPPNKEQRQRKKRSHSQRMETFAAIPMAILAVLLAVSFLPRRGYRRPPQVSQLRDEIMSFSWELPDWNTLFGIRFQGFGDGDLRNLGSLNYSGREVLKIKTNRSQTVYLHNFVGAKLEQGRWSPISDEEYRRAAVNFPEITPQTIGGEYISFPSVYSEPGEIKPCLMTVRNIAFPEETVFLTANLLEIDATAVSFSGDAMAYRCNDAETYSYAYFPLDRGLTSFVFTNDYEDKAPSIRDAYLRSEEDFLWNQRYSMIALVTTNQKGTLFSDFASHLQDYNAYVYDTYTALPDETLQAAQTLIEKYGLELRHYEGAYDIQEAISSVRLLLQGSCRYSTKPKPIPSDADFTTYFLEESKEGYCVHFSTAATVLLRALGIPVRYAEGFVLSELDFRKESDEEGFRSISDNRAHAWIEIYDPYQLEWIPVEMTPGFVRYLGRVDEERLPSLSSAAPQSSSSAASSEAETPSSSRQPTSSREPTSSRAPTSSAPGQPGTHANPSDGAFSRWTPLFAVLLATVFAVLLFVVVRRAKVVRRKKKLSQEDENRAVLYGCRCLIAMLRAAGCPAPKNNDTPQSYTEKACAVRPALPRDRILAALEAGQKARFAEKPCTQEEQESVAALVEELPTAIPHQLKKPCAALFCIRFPR